MTKLSLVVRESRAETPLVRRLVLAPSEGELLPPFEPGAHIRVDLPLGGDRPYSLVDLPQIEPGTAYVLGVRLENPSHGGSLHMHSLRRGDKVTARGPINHFPLHDDARPALLFAGGIGITPILSMARRLAASGRGFRLHYAVRSRDQLAFLPELEAICDGCLSVHPDDEPERLDIAKALAAAPREAVVYVCGPAGMIEAVRSASAAAGYGEVRSELFTPPAAEGEDAAFEVELASSGEVLTVAPGQSIIDALEAAGHDVLYDCRRGDCGVCQTTVLEGIPDHRDVILSDSERASNTVMQICVSRAKTPRLKLDL